MHLVMKLVMKKIFISKLQSLIIRFITNYIIYECKISSRERIKRKKRERNITTS